MFEMWNLWQSILLSKHFKVIFSHFFVKYNWVFFPRILFYGIVSNLGLYSLKHIDLHICLKHVNPANEY
jgi:hypothetical protein